MVRVRAAGWYPSLLVEFSPYARTLAGDLHLCMVITHFKSRDNEKRVHHFLYDFTVGYGEIAFIMLV